MSTLKKIMKIFAMAFIAISCCSCNESSATKESEIFERPSSSIQIVSGTSIASTTVSNTSTVRSENSVTTSISSISETSAITEVMQTTQTSENTEVSSITTVNTPVTSTNSETNQIEANSASPIFWQDGYQYYKIQPNDSWSSIAEYLGVDPIQLAAANNSTLYDVLYVGDNLFIPNEYVDYTQQNSVVSQNNVQPQQQMQNSNSGQYLGSGQVYSAPDSASWTNIAQAVADINGLTLAPGEYFSWNSYVGWKTAQDVNPETGVNDWGYVEAPVIDGTGPGGGICVVSTTLNKAARASGIEYIVNYPHSRPVSYASGEDEAAVDYGSKDLQFSNPFDYTIVFYATCSYGSVSISCYVA